MRCGTFGPLPAETGGRGSSAWFGIHVAAGTGMENRTRANRSTKSGTSIDWRRNPETLALQGDDLLLIKRAMENVPDRFRELLVLRELEGLSYREIAEVMNIPMGTVMSSLSRARQAFRGALDNELQQSGIDRPTRD